MIAGPFPSPSPALRAPGVAPLEAPAPAATGGVGFAALFLALLAVPSAAETRDGTDAPAGVDGGTGNPGSGDAESAPAPAGRSSDAGPRAQTPAQDPTGGIMAPLGRVTTAGWAALGGAPPPEQPSRDEPAAAQDPVAWQAPVNAAAPEAPPAGAPSSAAAPSDAADGERAAADAVAASAAGASATARPVAPLVPGAPTDVHTPDSNPLRLHPELKEKVERVIQRMEVEHGLHVRLVEGYRSPERQLHLYAQGRTRPGPVVTWTEESRHQEGRAADLKVEGVVAGLEGYVTLQRIAREEGLKTLGMKDPGHVELAGGSRTWQGDVHRLANEASGAHAHPVAGIAARRGVELGEGTTTPASAGIAPLPPRPARTAPVARMARAARVADLGQVAHVARTAPEAGTSSHESFATPTLPPSVTRPAAGIQAGPAAGVRVAEPVSGTGRRPSQADDARPAADVPPSDDVARAAPTQVITLSASTQREAPRPPVLGGTGTSGRIWEAGGPEPMGRVERVMEALEARPAAEVQRVVVRLDGSTGPLARVGVELADRALRGRVQADDPALAERLRADVGAVLRKLEASGYDARSIAVGLTSGDIPADGVGRVLHALDAAPALRTFLAASSGASGHEGRERQGGEGRHGHAGQGPFDQRTQREDRRER